LGAVQDGIQPLGHHIEVLGVDRGDEGVGERPSQLPLGVVGLVLEVRDTVGGAGLGVGPADQRRHALAGDLGLPAQHVKDVGVLGQKPAAALHGSHLQMGTRIAASSAAAGKVVTQASRILPTTSQPTWRYRRRATPTPPTREETTWGVLAGAPTTVAARITAAELVWLTRPSTGRMRKMRRPMVLTIRHPPIAVPRVSATAQARIAQTGAESDWVVPLASSSTASTPTAFWASLAPWLKASHPEVTHCARSTGRFARAVTRRSQRRTPRSSSQAAPKPSTGEIASAPRTPTTPVGCPPPTPPQLTAPSPASTTAAPTSPPT